MDKEFKYQIVTEELPKEELINDIDELLGILKNNNIYNLNVLFGFACDLGDALDYLNKFSVEFLGLNVLVTTDAETPK